MTDAMQKAVGSSDQATGRDAGEDDFGRHIRNARVARGLTLEALAQATGLSRSYLSNIERNVNSPTISSLRTVMDALGLPLSELFRTVEKQHGVLTRPDQRVEIVKPGDHGIRFELLNPDPDSKLEFVIMTVDPGASSGATNHTHAGDEVGLMLEGTLDYWVDDVKYTLTPGDAMSFPATRPHRYHNPGDVPAVSTWCVTPPSF